MKTKLVLSRLGHTPCAAFCLALLMFSTVFSNAIPIITDVVETGGDNDPADTVPAKWTGVTWSNHQAGEPVPGLAAGDPYTVGLFGHHAPAMVDRNHRYSDTISPPLPIPAYLVGGEYIMCGNDNRDNGSFRLDVTVSEPVLVFLLIDNRLQDGNNADPPLIGPNMQWVLDEGWIPVTTGANRAGDPGLPDEVGIDEAADGDLDQWFSVYTKDFPAGTFTLLQPDNGGRNMYGVVVTRPPDSINNPPKIVNVVPANNTLFYNAAGGLSFEATTISPNSIAPANIRLSLNGTDVSSSLVIGGTPSSRTAAYNNLAANTIYRAHIEVSDQEARTTTLDFSFDTFNAATAVAIEAEDYNYGSGQFLSPSPPGAYAGLVGTPEIDYHDNNVATPAAEYRTTDFVGLGVSGDGPRQYFIDAGATDYQVIQFIAGDWMNYTRNFDNQTYIVYLRAAGGMTQPVRLDKILGDPSTPAQTPFALGAFTVANPSYAYLPLTDAFGNTVRVNLSGPNTLRLTALFSANPASRLNFLLLVPATPTARPPYLSEVSPSINAVNVFLDATVNVTIANGSTQVSPGSVRLHFNGTDVTGSAMVSPSADGVQISYDPPDDLNPNTAYPVKVSYSDTGRTPFNHEWTLTTVPYPPIIVSVIETGGDDSVNTPAQFTGQVFSHPNLGTIRLGTFQEDTPAFRDRVHQWNGASSTLGLPPYLVGGEYIMSRNDNRDNNPYQLDVEISQPALVYVLVDNRLSDGANGNPPDFSAGNMMWLIDNGWTPVLNGLNRNNNPAVPDEVGVDEGGDGLGPGAGLNQWSSVYVKRIEDASFSLFQADNAGRNMYGVVIRSVATHAFTPTVAITAPADGAVFPVPPNTIAITAEASVENSAITKVEFFLGALNKSKIGEDTTMPYQAGCSDLPPGRYVLTAKATAANGQSAVSAPVTIVVGEVLSVNFQATTATIPAGYLPDYGDVFADRGNGASYGWDDDNTQHARDRNDARSPDERYDTLNHMQKTTPLPAGSFWEIDVPNRTYLVHVVVGDPGFQDSVYDLTAEGTTIVTGTPDAVVRWFEATATVTVSDGRLTLGNGPTAANNKICFVDIATLPPDLPRPVIIRVTLNGTTLTIMWTGCGGLQQAPEVTGPWTNVPGDPRGSYTTQATEPRMFYRVVSP